MPKLSGGPRCVGTGRRILLAIHTAYADPTSGAARSVRTIVEWLAAAGYSCRVLATSRFDGLAPQSFDEHLAELNVAIEPLRLASASSNEISAVQFKLAGVPVTTVLTRHNRLDAPDAAESRQFLAAFDEIAQEFQPDLVFTYGSHPVVQETMRRARHRGIKTLFTIRRDGYEDSSWFRYADHVLTAGLFLKEHYRRAIGLESTGIEPPIDWSAALAEENSREFVTFVNPSLQKGAAFFARLADRLGASRPDIPILVVESSIDSRVLTRFPEVNLAQYPQIMIGPPTSCPADFFALTKILLAPSLGNEAFARIAAEALINGVPPLVSTRGGLPAAVRGAGRVLPVPDWMTPSGTQLPSVEEVEPWYRAICELWDDPRRYAAASALARRTANKFYAESTMRRRYVEYFDSLLVYNAPLKIAPQENCHAKVLQAVP